MNAALAVARREPTPGRVLLYHEISDRSDLVAAVPPRLFRSHREWVASRGLRFTSVDGMLGAGSPPGLVGLSFDDGDRSVIDVCAELAAAGHAATVFVVPDWVEASRATVCSWSDLARLARLGIEIAAHDLAHERPCGVAVDVLTERYGAARRQIEERLGIAVRGLAYPYGLAPGRARTAAARSGYSYAVTSEPGRNDQRTDPFRLRRNEMQGTDTTESSVIGKLAGTDDWMRPLRALENRIACG